MAEGGEGATRPGRFDACWTLKACSRPSSPVVHDSFERALGVLKRFEAIYRKRWWWISVCVVRVTRFELARSLGVGSRPRPLTTGFPTRRVYLIPPHPLGGEAASAQSGILRTETASPRLRPSRERQLG